MTITAEHTFRDVFGTGPDGQWRAPGRVNLIGEHTDYNDGFVLPIAIQYATTVYARLRDDKTIRVASLQAPSESPSHFVSTHLTSLIPRSVAGWSSYPLGVIWALSSTGLDRGADLLIDGRVPIGSGLSSSAALECSVALAVSELADLGLGKDQLVDVARQAENDFVGVPSGMMDQTASLGCTHGNALLLDTRSRLSRQVPFSPATERAALLVIETGVRHRLGISDYGRRREECLSAASGMGIESLRDIEPVDLDQYLGHLSSDTLRRRVSHVVTENARVLEFAALLDAGTLRTVGPILTASHNSLSVDFEVSCSELDLAVSTALDSGALGARMVGGGFGGAVIALVGDETRGAVETTVRSAFSNKGYAAPHIFEAESSDGAMRIR